MDVLNTQPVLYIEEVLSDKTLDWRACVRYQGYDTYVLYGVRWNGKTPQFRMQFLSRKSVFSFLNGVVSKDSKVNLTLYNVERSQLLMDNFDAYYNSYNVNNELVGYDDLTYDEYSDMLTDYLLVLRDSRPF